MELPAENKRYTFADVLTWDESFTTTWRENAARYTRPLSVSVSLNRTEPGRKM